MKKSLMAAMVAAASAAMAQQAQAAPPKPERIEHVLVSVPVHKKVSESALPVTVLTGRELHSMVASSIGETLGDMPGIANSTFGPGVGRPVIRGQQGPRSFVLQNGIASADVSALSPDHAVSAEPMLAQSIEVLRGPATLLYGGGAIGGVVNIQDNRIPTQAIDGIEGGIEYRYDDAPEMDTTVGRLEGGNGKFAFHLSGTLRDFDDLSIPGLAIDEAALEQQEELLGIPHDEDGEEELENSDGSIENTDGDSDAITLGASYHFGEKGFFGLSYNRFETNYGIPAGSHEHDHGEEHGHGDEDHDDHGDDHGEDHDDHDEDHDHEAEEEENVRIDLEQERYDALVHVHDLVPGVIDVARGFLTFTDYNHTELEGAETGTVFDRETWEGRLELVRNADNHSVLGLQWRDDDFSAVGDEAYLVPTESTEFGVFFLQDLHLSDWQVELGGRVDYVERDPENVDGQGAEDFTAYSLSVAGLYQIAPDWTTSLSISRSARAPAAEELFSNLGNAGEELVTHVATGIIEIGDRNLDEEVSFNFDASLNWLGDRSFANLSVYYNSFQDYIFLDNTSTFIDETPVYQYLQDDAVFYGVEFDSDFHLADLAGGELALGVFGDVTVGEFDDAGDVPRLPPMRIGSELSWRSDAFGAYVRVINADDQDNAGNFETETDGYTRWDAGVDYRMTLMANTELLAFVKWKNIGDEEIRLSTSFLRNFAPEPGESIEAGIRLTF